MMLVHGLGVGGTESMIAHLARHLRRRGSEVEIGCLGVLGTLGEELREEGVRVFVHERQPGLDRTLPVRLARRLRQGSFDVVHAHQRTGLAYALLSGLLHTIPLVYTEHGPRFGGRPGLKVRTFNRLLGWRLSRVTAVSNSLGRELARDEGFAGKKVEVVPNAVDVERFGRHPTATKEEARRRIGFPVQARVLGTVGRLEPVKNHALLLHVIARLKATVPDLLLAIAGDGKEQASLERLARDLGVEDRVRLLGLRRDIECLLPGFDVFCLSSRAEGVPLSLLEAMAARVPIVSTAVGGVSEVVRSEREAILVPGVPPDCRSPASGPHSSYVETFTDAVERLLQNPALCRALVDRALDRVTEAFSVASVCFRYEEILAAAARG